MCYSKKEVREFIRQYLVAALWSSHDYRSDPASCEYDPNADIGEMMDDNFEPDDLDPRCVADVRADVFSFLRQCEEQGIDLPKLADVSLHAHDLWLTRNHHGAGFWDRGYGDACQRLTKIAHDMGEVHCSAWTGETFGIE